MLRATAETANFVLGAGQGQQEGRAHLSISEGGAGCFDVCGVVDVFDVLGVFDVLDVLDVIDSFDGFDVYDVLAGFGYPSCL